MANNPERSIRIPGRDVLHDGNSRWVISVLLEQFSRETSCITSKRLGVAIAHRAVPERIGALTCTTAAEKKVVIQAIVISPLLARIDCCSLECDNDCLILLIGEDMTT